MSLAELVQEKESEESSTVLVPRPEADSDPESDGEVMELGNCTGNTSNNFDESLGNNILKEIDEFTEIEIDESALQLLETANSEQTEENFLELISDIITEKISETTEPDDQLRDNEEELMNNTAKSPIKIAKARKQGQKSKSKNKVQYDWKEEEFLYHVEIVNDNFSPSATDKSPLDYFKMFFDDDLINLIVENTNLYSVQMTSKSIQVTQEDISDFLAIELLVGIVQMPAYTDFWSHDLRYEKIASVMSLKRYQAIRRYIHFVDNKKVNNDRYFKIRPVLESIRKNCLAVDQ